MNWPEHALLSGQITHNMAFEHTQMVKSHVVTSCISCCDAKEESDALKNSPGFSINCISPPDFSGKDGPIDISPLSKIIRSSVGHIIFLTNCMACPSSNSQSIEPACWWKSHSFRSASAWLKKAIWQKLRFNVNQAMVGVE